MSKPFSIVAILMLMGLCALHAVQVASGQPLIIGGGAVPLLGSVIAIVAMIAVAIGLWVEAFGGTDDAPSTGPATTRGASRGMTRGKGAPVWEANGQRLPGESIPACWRLEPIESWAIRDWLDRAIAFDRNCGLKDVVQRLGRNAEAVVGAFEKLPGATRNIGDFTWRLVVQLFLGGIVFKLSADK